MTVGELIDRLREFDSHAEVYTQLDRREFFPSGLDRAHGYSRPVRRKEGLSARACFINGFGLKAGGLHFTGRRNRKTDCAASSRRYSRRT